MTNLISGADALIALANGVEVQCRNNITGTDWTNAKCLLVESFFNPTTMRSFRLKPRTITINGIEVPAPFKPKYGDTAFVLSRGHKGYRKVIYKAATYSVFGAWRTEDEIKQVVAALRQVFGGV